jgi:hypothetical protein
MTPVVLQLCILAYSPYLYLRPYAYGTPRKGKLCFVRLWQGFLVFFFSFFFLVFGFSSSIRVRQI